MNFLATSCKPTPIWPTLCWNDKIKLYIWFSLCFQKTHGPNWGLPMYTFEEHPHSFYLLCIGVFPLYPRTFSMSYRDFNIVFTSLSTSIAQRNFSILPLVEFVKQPIEVNFNFWPPWQPYNQKFPKQKPHITTSELNPKLCVNIGYKIGEDVYRAIKTWFVSCRHKFGNCYDMDTYTLDNIMHNDPRNTLTSKNSIYVPTKVNPHGQQACRQTHHGHGG
jgi:hypothetical protein